MTKKSILRSLIIVNVYIFMFFPLGFGSGVKYFSIFLMIVVFIWAKRNIVTRNSLCIYLLLSILLFISYLHFMMSPLFYFDSFVLLQSLLLSILIFYIVNTSYKNGVISFPDLVKYAIYGLASYSILKFIIAILIYLNILNIDFLQIISPDFNSLGYIGVTGFNRIVGVNDFLLPFMFFMISSSSLKNKNTIRLIFIFSIFLSFTRSLWLSFILLYIIEQVFLKKKVHVAIITIVVMILSVYYVSAFTDINLIGSIQDRLFNEGALSSSVKFEQAQKMIQTLDQYPLFGQGLGSYVDGYIRNDRLKYGYEVMILALVMQNGLVISFIIISLLGYSLYKAYRINGKLFDLFSLMLFISSGFTNPVIISSVSVYLYVLYAIKFTYKEN